MHLDQAKNDQETIWITPGLAKEGCLLFNMNFLDWFDCHFYSDKFTESTNSSFVLARLS